MHHHHGHHPTHDHHTQRSQNKKSLMIALFITCGMMFLEFFGGLWTGSLALLSDAGHMLSDASSLFLSFVAMWFASKPPSARKTYGYYRFEILAALFNSLTLFIVAGFIIWEAIERIVQPTPVSSLSMMGIATVGLFANLLSAWVLMRKGDVKENLNLRSAYLHILSDALGSIGAILAGILMYFFSWYFADILVSFFVTLLILRSAWGVMTHSIHILMEGTPITIDSRQVEKVLTSISGVINVHDLHIWTITSQLDSLSCHLLIEKESDSQQILQQAIHLIEKHFQIQHTTIQIETSDFQHTKCEIPH